MLRNRQKDLFELCVDLGVFKESEKTGRHFLLADGNHCGKFFDFPFGFTDAEFRRVVGTEVMEELGRLGLDHDIDVIITPAIGGILLCGTIQHLFYGRKPLLVYTEKVRGVQTLCRNFRMEPNQRVLAFDDVCNSGASLVALKRICDYSEAMVVAMGALVNRGPSGKPKLLDSTVIPNIFLLTYPIREYTAEECQNGYWCRSGIPLEKDGKLVDKDGNMLESAKPVDE